MMDTIFIVLGMAATLWFAVGFFYLLFFMEVRMPPAPWHPPFWIKVQSVLSASFMIPYLMLTFQARPKGMAIHNSEMPHKEVMKWLAETCQCDACKERRGEQ